ncbi:hypothetical protein F5Y19DRAFT_431354 [Xylariaceae sp. FL1651]|nr:hypothetical protein F5Y19DRAFT_431354 [Xylariaceae sp. FL1651]
MSNDTPFYILDPRRLLPEEDAASWLGRIVKDYKDPAAWMTPKDIQKSLQCELPVNEVVIDNIDTRMSSLDDASLKIGLTNIASVLSGSGRDGSFSFQTTSMRVVRLQGYSNVFNRICRLPEVRGDLESVMRPGGKPFFLIVGLLVLTDVKFAEHYAKMKSVGFDATAPVIEVASAAVSGMPLPIDVGDPMLGRTAVNGRERKWQGSVSGSYIFGFEYKAVRRKAYSLMKNFMPQLKAYGPRGQGDHVFHHGGETEGPQMGLQPVENAEVDIGLIVDDEDAVWVDTLEDGLPREVEFLGLTFALDGE